MANSVTLNGTLSATYSADVTVYWGLTDGETTPSAWSNASSLGTVMLGAFSTNESVLAGGMYYYRCYATNSAGEAWADSTGTFTTPLAAVSIADATVVEGDAGTLDAVFAVTLSGPSVSNVTVGYAASSGSAMEGADFAATNGVLSIPAGQTNAQIAVTVNADTEYEYSGETFSVRLSGPAGCTIADGTATGTIVDDDLPEHLARLSSRMKITLDEYAGSETLTNFNPVGKESTVGVFGTLDYLASNWFLPVGGLLIAVFVGWFLSNKETREELETGHGDMGSRFGLWRFCIRFAAPIAVGAIIVSVILGAEYQ